MSHFRRSVLALFALAIIVSALFTACGSSSAPGTPGTPATPAAPPATPPPVVAAVSFEAAEEEVYEGDTAALSIRYEARNLASPWRLRVSPLPGTTQSGDFSLPNAVVEIPAGQGTTGTVAFDFTALADNEFDEGTETLSLRFVPDPSVNAELGGDLAISIREGGALVTFAAGTTENPLEVVEGDAVEVPIFYEVRNLAAPLDLSLSPIADTARPGEFRLEESAVTLPAGRGVSGSASVRLVATEDVRFAEGDETGRLRFVPEEGVIGVRLGVDARFVIRESGASPCPGISLRALPPATLPAVTEWTGRSLDTINDALLSTTLTVTQETSATEAELFLRSPYFAVGDQPQAALAISGWRVEPQGDARRLSVDLRWPTEELRFVEPQLEFGFIGGGCDGEVIATCSADGCELIFAGSAASVGGGR